MVILIVAIALLLLGRIIWLYFFCFRKKEVPSKLEDSDEYRAMMKWREGGQSRV